MTLRKIPWFWALPSVLFVVAFLFAPVVAGSWYAFTDWTGLGRANWVGLDNFDELFSSDETRGAFTNSIVLAVTFLLLANAIGLAFALALNRTLKTRNVLRAVLFLPVVMSPLAVSYIWQYIFTNEGALNSLLVTVGLDSWQRPWLGDPTWALWTILLVLVWQFAGLTMVIYLAGLQSISDELLEATAVDGASVMMRFRRVIFPLLAPAITVNATLCLIIGLRVFDQILALTGGGPVHDTETLATQVYQQAFVNGRYGYGIANALVLTVLIVAVAFAQLVVLRRREARI